MYYIIQIVDERTFRTGSYLKDEPGLRELSSGTIEIMNLSFPIPGHEEFHW
jgi:hypothetical protein